MWNPLSWVMEAAAIMAIALAHGGTDIRGKVPTIAVLDCSTTSYYNLLLIGNCNWFNVDTENERRLP